MYDGPSAQLTNDTVDGNSDPAGGGIYLAEPGATLTNDTIVRNNLGGIYEPSLASGIVNTIVADNGHRDCEDGVAGTTADQGHNLDSDGACFGSTHEVAGDLVVTNPVLGSLAPNGGLTQTDALLSGSPAIGAALSSSCPATDQRGVPRTGSCDIGAFQTAPADLAVAVSAPATGTAGGLVEYTVTVTNNGPGPATGVNVTDAVPAGSTYFGSDSSQGTCSGTTTVTCQLGTIDSANTSSTGSAGTATMNLVVVPSHAGVLTDTASVSAATSDPNAANNTASASTSIGVGPTTATVLTGEASEVTATSATLSGIVNPGEETTAYSFQLGTSTA